MAFFTRVTENHRTKCVLANKAVRESEEEHILAVDYPLTRRRHWQPRRGKDRFKRENGNVTLPTCVTNERRLMCLPISISEYLDGMAGR